MFSKNPKSKRNLIPSVKTLLQPFSLKDLKKTASHAPENLGAAPGIDSHASANIPPEAGEIHISTIDLCKSEREERTFETIDELLDTERPAWSSCRWIDIQGIHPYVLKKLQERFGIHPLAAEDTLHVPQRSKVEEYEDSLFIVLRMIRLSEQNLVNEQVSFFFFRDTVITVQEKKGDVWSQVRERTKKKTSRFREYGAPYILYALVDAIIDHIFPFLDLYFESIDKLEEEIMVNPTPSAQVRIHAIKRELIYLRQAIWPMQNVISTLAKDDYQMLPSEVESYFRDVHDHATQASEAIDMYRETAIGLQDLYMASSSNRMNEVMKALTIMASLFLPLTFLAGIYGMNFKVIPELEWEYSYPVFWLVCITTIGSLLWYFKRKKWI